MNRTFLIVAVIVVVAVGGFFLFRGRSTGAPTVPRNETSSPTVEPPATAAPAPTTTGGQTTQPPATPAVREFTVTAKQFAFDPAVIIVRKGERVRLHITSVDVTHGFALPDFGVNVDLQPNQTKTVEFIASKVGTFSFFCSVFCGSGHSAMRGTLQVVE